MRVVRVPTTAGDFFHVYADHDESDHLRGMVAFLRGHSLKFAVGGTAEDCSRVLTIGPLPDGDDVAFLQAWGSFIVR